jgi:hydrogenase-4 component B
MGVLVACCFLIGLAPQLVAPVLGMGIAAWSPNLTEAGTRLTALAPLGWISLMGFVLIASLALGGVFLWMRLRANTVEYGATWGCGYLAPNPRMQYTSSSFAQMLVGLFGWVLRPRIHRPRNLPLFPQNSAFHSEVPDTVLDEAVLPAFGFVAWLFSRLRILQQGNVQIYLLYIFMALVALLLWRT